MRMSPIDSYMEYLLPSWCCCLRFKSYGLDGGSMSLKQRWGLKYLCHFQFALGVVQDVNLG